MTELTLAGTFRSLEGPGPVDPEDFHAWCDFTEPVAVDVPPGDFLLGQSVEHIVVPEGWLGIVFARSTLLRCGLAFGCGFLQPGWSGRLVFELGNLNRHRPLRLRVGRPVAHVHLFRAADLPRYTGRYLRDNPMAPLPDPPRSDGR